MRRYETIVIVDPDISEADRDTLLERISDLIPKQNGELITQEDWGVKKLAYEIKKKPRGQYLRYDLCGDGPMVDELERFFRIDDRVMKYMTVLLDKDADPEKIREEIAAAQAGAAEEEASGEASAAETAEPAADTPPAPESTATEEPKEESNPEPKEEEK